MKKGNEAKVDNNNGKIEGYRQFAICVDDKYWTGLENG